MEENTLDNRGQWTGKRDSFAPRRGPMPCRDDANGGGDTTSDDTDVSLMFSRNVTVWQYIIILNIIKISLKYYIHIGIPISV